MPVPFFFSRIVQSTVWLFGIWSMGFHAFGADSGVVPSETPFDLSTATTYGATVAPAETGINIIFQPGTGYPGITWRADSAWDWSGAVQLVVILTNTGSSSTRLYYLTKDVTGKDLYAGISGPLLEPGKTYTIVTDLTRGTPNDCKWTYGMNFPPLVVSGKNVWLNDQKGTLDLTKVANFKIFMQKPPTEPVTINVQSIKIYKPDPIKALYTNIIDQFGQYANATWNNKISDTSEFAKRLADENTDLAAHPNIADYDEYGAWTGGEKVSPAPGFFQAINRGGKWWLVAPNGNLFLSFGFDCLWPGGNPDSSTNDTPTITQGREYMFQTIPKDAHASKSGFHYGPFKGTSGFGTYDFYGANADKKYGNKYGSGDYVAGWNEQVARRMHSWGFNTIANWSDTSASALRSQHKFAYVVTLNSGSPSKIDHVPDPFDPGFVTQTDARFKKIITPEIAVDPWCLGYFCDNELQWSKAYPEWGDYASNVQNRYSLAEAVLEAGATQPAKVAFQAQVQSEYGDISKLNDAWAAKFVSWEAFLKPYKVPVSPSGKLIADMGAFTQAYAAKYATTIKSIIQKYDPHHLYLGCRFAVASPDVVKGVAQQGGCDVVSFNIYAQKVDPKIWADTNLLNKPCIVSEYHFGAQDSGLFGYGNGTAIRAIDQESRAAMYTAYMKSLLAMPAFVGAHWYQFADEPVAGRNFDGENYNTGFVDVADNPYQLMVNAARDIHAQAYTLHQSAATP